MIVNMSQLMICKYVKDFSDCSLQVSCGSYNSVDFGISGLSGSITASDIEPATSFSSSLNDPNSMTQKFIEVMITFSIK